MAVDARTLAVYDTQAADYARMISAAAAPGLDRFIAAMPPGGHVLDLGAGPGNAARAMQDAGLRVDATDASAAMVEAARAQGVSARQATFEEIAAQGAPDTYDGIWANFSLLHAPRAAFPGHLAALNRAMRPGGLLHIGMKLGEGERRDALGRFYTYYDEEALVQHLTTAGFTPVARFHGKGRGLDGTVAPWIWVQARG